MKNLQITIPSLGESITEATISKWMKKIGEYIEKDEVIAEIETDKVTQEIYAGENGIVSKIFFEEGKNVKIGDIIATLDLLTKENKLSNDEIVKNSNLSKTKIELKVPSLGESIKDVIIGKWLINEGNIFKKGTPLVEVETDKVTQELYAEKDAKLVKIIFREDEEAKIGDTIAILEEQKINQLETEKKLILKKENDSTQDTYEKTMLDLDPTNVKRTGIGNKINIDDIKEFAGSKSLSPSGRKYVKENGISEEFMEKIDKKDNLSKSDFIENNTNLSIEENAPIHFKENNNKKESKEPLSKLRQSIAKKLKDAQNSAAMLTTFNEINMLSVINIRKKYKESFFIKYKVKLGFMSFFTKATILVLKEIPEINAEIRNNNIIYKNRYDIGIAVGTEKGLYVPIIRDADEKSFAQIEREIIKYGNLAKENKITMDHMKDGTFTISNGGVYGSMLSTPILNAPQSGILGLHNIVSRPIAIDDKVLIRPIMYVALTYDHRIIDGKQAVTFLVRLKEIIENPERIIFEL